VTFLEVTLEAGQAEVPHRHAGPVFGYVLKGEFEWAIDDQPAKVLKAGETFHEPTGCLHRVAKKPGREGQDPCPGRRTAPAGRQADDHSRAEEEVTPARP
jgi:hypothetical protein